MNSQMVFFHRLPVGDTFVCNIFPGRLKGGEPSEGFDEINTKPLCKLEGLLQRGGVHSIVDSCKRKEPQTTVLNRAVNPDLMLGFSQFRQQAVEHRNESFVDGGKDLISLRVDNVRGLSEVDPAPWKALQE